MVGFRRRRRRWGRCYVAFHRGSTGCSTLAWFPPSPFALLNGKLSQTMFTSPGIHLPASCQGLRHRCAPCIPTRAATGMYVAPAQRRHRTRTSRSSPRSSWAPTSCSPPTSPSGCSSWPSALPTLASPPACPHQSSRRRHGRLQPRRRGGVHGGAMHRARRGAESVCPHQGSHAHHAGNGTAYQPGHGGGGCAISPPGGVAPDGREDSEAFSIRLHPHALRRP